MSAADRRLATKLQAIHQILEMTYGEHLWEPHHRPVAELVNTILSQNTNDHNRDLAFAALRDRYPSWEAVRDAPLDELIATIRPAGLAPTKAPRIQGALRRITAARGEIALDFLQELPLEAARNWLIDIKGVGPKTAAIVLLFALGRPAFPVDTHVHRVSQRLGLIPTHTSREKAHLLLEELVPSHLYYPLHLELIEHGRAICQARQPRCALCPLYEYCIYSEKDN